MTKKKEPKVKLEDLRVQTFVTTLSTEEKNVLRGGSPITWKPGCGGN